MDAKTAGDAVLVVGETRDELGGSEYLLARGLAGGFVPKLDRALSKPVLEAVAACTRAGVANAVHDCSDGGLGVALAEMAFSGGLGMAVDAAALPRRAVDRLDLALFSESLSRLVLTVPKSRLERARGLLKGVPHAVVGEVILEPELRICGLGGALTADLAGLKRAWQGTLAGMAV
jgi:phosphoribosylformylglycinamidine synthase